MEVSEFNAIILEVSLSFEVFAMAPLWPSAIAPERPVKNFLNSDSEGYTDSEKMQATVPGAKSPRDA